MTHTVLEPQTRVLQHVPRWAIIRTIRQQSVAEHSYYVAMYATFIANHIKMKKSDVNWITQYALTHDFEEMISGDIPTPYKRHFRLDDDYMMTIPREMASSIQTNNTTLEKYCIEVVKVADIFEACMYLADEIAMGNTTVHILFATLCKTLVDKADKLDESLPDLLTEKIHQTPRTYLCSDMGF